MISDARELFDSGFNCAQSVLAVYGPRFGVGTPELLRLSTPFGSGIAGTGGMCGAVTGALMVLGLAYGRDDIAREDAKLITNEKCSVFLQRFSGERGSVVCRELLGHDISDPAVREMVRERGLFRTQCPVFVESAAALLEELLP
jgi:C_GCAxxG_C_C family probable redox protein